MRERDQNERDQIKEAAIAEATTASRKAEHIRINLEEDVSGKGITTGLERYHFTHSALPECDLAEVDRKSVV